MTSTGSAGANAGFAPVRAATFERVCGGLSMVPTVFPGDPIYLAPPRPLRSGDVVVFRGQGDYDVVHRFLFKVPFAPYFAHRGDAANVTVGLARCDRVVGVADLPSRRPTRSELLAACGLVARRAAERLVVGHQRRQRAR